MRLFASFSWLLILVPMALFVGCGDGCGKKEQPAASSGQSGATPTEGAKAKTAEEGKTASTSEPSDTSGSSENAEDAAVYQKTQYDGSTDASSTRSDPGVALDTSFDIEPSDWTEGKIYDTTKTAGPGGAGADTWSAGSKDGNLPDRDRLQRCAHKNTSLNATKLCAKIGTCGMRETCPERLALDGALFNSATAKAFAECLNTTDCATVGKRNDGLYGHCFEKAIGAQPAQGAGVCAKVGAKLEGCSLTGTAAAFNKRCPEVFKPLRSSVLDAYAACANVECSAVVRCITNAGCGTFSLE